MRRRDQAWARPRVVAWLAFLLIRGAAWAADEQAPPQAGGLQSLPEQKTQAIALANPGFEQELSGWKPAKPSAFSIAAGPAAAHSGNACLRLDCGERTPYVPSLLQPLDVGPGVYVLRFWCKVSAVGAEGSKNDGARVSIEYLLRSGQRAWPCTGVFRGTQDWRREELRVHLPPDLKPGSVALSIHRYGGSGGGEALFDDFRLERLLPPPVEAFLLYPNFRGFLPEDGPSQARLWVRVNAADAKEPPRVHVKRVDDGSAVLTKPLPGGAPERVVELDSQPWPLGRYAIEVQLGEYRYPPYLVHKISAKARQRLPVWFDPNQVLHLDGKPTFPLGLYNTMRHFSYETLDFPTEFERLKKMAEAPVNANLNYWWWGCGTAVRRRYLTEMQKHGLWYLDTVNNVYPGFPRSPCVAELVPDAGEKLDTQEKTDLYLTRLAQAMRGMPAFLGWYVMDERAFAEVPRHFHQAAVLRKADPEHPLYGVSDRPQELVFWRDTLDVLGLDPYALFNMKAGRPLTMVADWTRAGLQATDGARPVWMVIQFFQGWSTDRWPTAEELRTMSLMAIAEGARGLFYWSFGNRGLMTVSDPKQQEDYWQRLVGVAKEIKSLEPALVAADAPQAVKAVSDPRVRWRARLAGGKCTVFAYLPSEKFVSDPAKAERTEVRFDFADGQSHTHTFRPDFADWFSAPVRKEP